MSDASLQSKLGRAIRVLRIAQGHTLPQVAYAAMISKGCLSKVENGKANLTLDTLERIAIALDVTSSDLLTAAQNTE